MEKLLHSNAVEDDVFVPIHDQVGIDSYYYSAAIVRTLLVGLRWRRRMRWGHPIIDGRKSLIIDYFFADPA
jgi:hypothetical protein